MKREIKYTNYVTFFVKSRRYNVSLPRFYVPLFLSVDVHVYPAFSIKHVR